jgi:hypothetical protein
MGDGAAALSYRALWHEVAYHQGNTTFGPIYKRAEALRSHPAMVELLRRARSDAWREGYGAGQRTDIAAETQTPNPHEDGS